MPSTIFCGPILVLGIFVDVCKDLLRNGKLDVTLPCGAVHTFPIVVNFHRGSNSNKRLPLKSTKTCPPILHPILPDEYSSQSCRLEKGKPSQIQYTDFAVRQFSQEFTPIPEEQPTIIQRGYIAQMLKPLHAGFYFSHLFKVDWIILLLCLHFNEELRCFRLAEGCFFLITPYLWQESLSPLTVDFLVNAGVGSVVPQTFWMPMSETNQRRYFLESSLELPIFFPREDGGLGYSITDAIARNVNTLFWRDSSLSFGSRTSAHVRINVCVYLTTTYFPPYHSACTVAELPRIQTPVSDEEHDAQKISEFHRSHG